MGQQESRNVIDLDLASLTREPQALFQIGREDLITDRPGQILMEEVRQFQANGGFRELEAERDRKHEKERQLDEKVGKREMKEFRVIDPVHQVVKADLAQEIED